MGYGASSKGGGGSITAGGSKQKVKGNKPGALKPRKVKGGGGSGESGGARTAAFSVAEPTQQQRARVIRAERIERRELVEQKQRSARNYRDHVTGTGVGGALFAALSVL